MQPIFLKKIYVDFNVYFAFEITCHYYLFSLGTIHILSQHNFELLRPTQYVSKQTLAKLAIFKTHPRGPFVNVINEWSLSILKKIAIKL